MKAAAFEIVRPRDLDAARAALGREGAKAAAGWQSLGPMLNLRLARPAVVVSIAHLPELRGVSETPEGVVYGACVTHAEIEDGAAPDPTRGALPAVAAGIAYRAVRNRGTIGGSLAHADPAADWPTALAAMGAHVRVLGADGVRRVAVEDFAHGAFAPALAPDELVVGVEAPRFSASARWGWWKFCRKLGEYAEAMCGVLVDPDRGVARAAFGATDGRPLVIADASEALRDPDALAAPFAAAGLDHDPVARRLHRAAFRRAAARAGLLEDVPT
ncbi:MAG: carbon monoxide dehydrogenase [Rhodobacteraceae bacterium]|nr:MAG: carbon monoxide dehydrogenase [Paracoccaceae bacterium]